MASERRVHDPEVLKAFAQPFRQRLYRLLAQVGPAEVLGEHPHRRRADLGEQAVEPLPEGLGKGLQDLGVVHTPFAGQIGRAHV